MFILLTSHPLGGCLPRPLSCACAWVRVSVRDRDRVTVSVSVRFRVGVKLRVRVRAGVRWGYCLRVVSTRGWPTNTDDHSTP